jgi:hypothetical protein
MVPTQEVLAADKIPCLDCGCDYAAVMPCSLNLPREQWLLIHPDGGGVLCANCMIRRAEKLPHATNITGRITFAGDY